MTPAEKAALRALAGQLNKKPPAGSTVLKGVVTAVNYDTVPMDISVALQGDSVVVDNVAFVDNFTPYVDDTVILVKQGASVLATGRVADGIQAHGWQNATLSGIEYRIKIVEGSLKVEFRGLATPSSSSLFTLPNSTVNYRPSQQRVVPCVIASNSDGRFVFNTNGTVTLQVPNTTPTLPNDVWFDDTEFFI